MYNTKSFTYLLINLITITKFVVLLKRTLTPGKHSNFSQTKVCMHVHTQPPQGFGLAKMLFCIKAWCVLVNYGYRYISGKAVVQWCHLVREIY